MSVEEIRADFQTYKQAIAKNSPIVDGMNLYLANAYRTEPYFARDCDNFVNSFRYPKIEFINRDQLEFDTYPGDDLEFYNSGIVDWKADPFYSPVSEDRFRYYLISFCTSCSQPYKKARITEIELEKQMDVNDLPWSSSGDEEYVTKYGCCDSCREELYREED